MKRLILFENTPCKSTISQLAEDLSVSADALYRDLESAGDSISRRLSLKDVLSIDRDFFSFRKIAGFIRVSDYLDIEVVPKFMEGNEEWRVNFLLILAHARRGSIVEDQLIRVNKSPNKPLEDMLATLFLSLFSMVKHIPIRLYRRKNIKQFQIEGDLDAESVFLPEADGFRQETTEFDIDNIYNSVIFHAAKLLIFSVKDLDIKTQLSGIENFLSPQNSLPCMVPRMVPSRFRRWQELYDLSCSILKGYGVDYLNQGELPCPSFVVKTADAWEEFLRRELIGSFGKSSVAFQRRVRFAKRDNLSVCVRPDYIIQTPDGQSLLVDAKYKYSSKHGSISNADIYEGYAFITATGIRRLVLIYPFVAETGEGCFRCFQTVSRDDWEIIGILADPKTAKEGGSDSFSVGLENILRPLFLKKVSN